MMQWYSQHGTSSLQANFLDCNTGICAQAKLAKTVASLQPTKDKGKEGEKGEMVSFDEQAASS